MKLSLLTGLRASVLTKLKVKDVKGKKSLRIISPRTGKCLEYGIPIKLSEEIQNYCENKNLEDYLLR